MKSYRRLYEEEVYKNHCLEFKYKGEIEELEEREKERAKAIDLLIGSIKYEQDFNVRHMQMYLSSEEARKKLTKKLTEAEWKISRLERELAEVRGEASE